MKTKALLIAVAIAFLATGTSCETLDSGHGSACGHSFMGSGPTSSLVSCASAARGYMGWGQTGHSHGGRGQTAPGPTDHGHADHGPRDDVRADDRDPDQSPVDPGITGGHSH